MQNGAVRTRLLGPLVAALVPALLLSACSGGDESARQEANCAEERRFMTDMSYDVRQQLGLGVALSCAEARVSWYNCLASGGCDSVSVGACSFVDDAYMRACFDTGYLWE